MKCSQCESPHMMKFIDGFGDRRIFCKDCGRSFLEESMQIKNSQQFKLNTYYKLPMSG